MVKEVKFKVKQESESLFLRNDLRIIQKKDSFWIWTNIDKSEGWSHPKNDKI